MSFLRLDQQMTREKEKIQFIVLLFITTFAIYNISEN